MVQLHNSWIVAQDPKGGGESAGVVVCSVVWESSVDFIQMSMRCCVTPIVTRPPPRGLWYHVLYHVVFSLVQSELMSDEEEDEDNDVIALGVSPDDKYRPQSLEKMIHLVAYIVEKSRDASSPNQLRIKQKDYYALVGNKVRDYFLSKFGTRACCVCVSSFTSQHV